MPVHAGRANEWGLLNLVGNVRELAIARPGRLAAHGGSYADRGPQMCNVETAVPHDGGADPYTGFRVVLELPAAPPRGVSTSPRVRGGSPSTAAVDRLVR